MRSSFEGSWSMQGKFRLQSAQFGDDREMPAARTDAPDDNLSF